MDCRRENFIALMDRELRSNIPCGELTEAHFLYECRKIMNNAIDHLEAAILEAKYGSHQ